jgi:hypothetical protein
MLECYLLISCFHHDLYGQFADFVKRNPEKVNDYFYLLINWEDKKFDKLRKEVGMGKVEKDDKKSKSNIATDDVKK